MFGDAGRLVSSSVPSVSFVDPKFNVSSPCRAESLLLVCTERQRERERKRERVSSPSCLPKRREGERVRGRAPRQHPLKIPTPYFLGRVREGVVQARVQETGLIPYGRKEGRKP